MLQELVKITDASHSKAGLYHTLLAKEKKRRMVAERMARKEKNIGLQVTYTEDWTEDEHV